MKATHLLLLALLLAAPGRAADSQAPNAPDAPGPASKPEAVRFEALDVFVDSGDNPLAAYQFELTAKTGDALLAGLEGGEHAAFKPAPYYDPRALLQNKVIVAAFSTRPDLPHGRTRVARLMVQVTGAAEPTYRAALTTAASADGKVIRAEVTVATVPAAAAGPSESPNPPGPSFDASTSSHKSPTSNASEGVVP